VQNQLVRQVKAEVQARAASDRALEEAGKLREELELGLIEARGREERLERELAASRGDAESMRGKFEVMRRERDAAREQVRFGQLAAEILRWRITH
jgi:chromosome condensin MukBEF ATPase and DNA-binding subunit MukB